MNNITENFGRRIRNIRQSKKLSQEKLAEYSGLHTTYIGQIERGEKSPTLDSIYKIATGLGVNINDLFDKTDIEYEDYATKIYNEVMRVSEDKKEKIYKIVCDIINL